MTYLGIDPGKSGAIVALPSREWIGLDESLADVWAWVHGLKPPVTALLESVHSTPQMGVTSAFSFGRAFGQVEALIVAAGTPLVRITPQKWQQAVGVHPIKGEAKGDHKRRLKARAQELFPGEKITNQTADAFLLAELCRRMHHDTP